MSIRTKWNLQRDGFCLLDEGVSEAHVDQLNGIFSDVFAHDVDGVLARSSRGHVYAARNLIRSIPEVCTVWQCESLLRFLRLELGDRFGLVRALFFDKPPGRTWALGWHKDTSIAVRDNRLPSTFFSRATNKAGVPHVIAADTILGRMLTLRIHLDEVSDQNGPLRVVPGSHISSDATGVGIRDAVTIHAKIGDVLAMRPLVTHSSGASDENTTAHRRILHLEFAGDHDLPDGYVWHDFIPAYSTNLVEERT